MEQRSQEVKAGCFDKCQKILPLRPYPAQGFLRDAQKGGDVSQRYPLQKVGKLLQQIQVTLPRRLELEGFHEITEANGFNVTRKMHHGVVHKSGTFVCASNLGDMYVNLCCLSASTAANPNDSMIIEQDYGRLSVIVYKK
jgi:hypothetical protein